MVYYVCSINNNNMLDKIQQELKAPKGQYNSFGKYAYRNCEYMDPSQITGAASSYARKYALNGLFAIDDTKDADSDAPSKDKPSTPEDSREWLNLTNKNGSTNAKYKELQELMWDKGMTNTALLAMAKKKYKVSKETEALILKMQEKILLENEDQEIDYYDLEVEKDLKEIDLEDLPF
jgi:hypothetical protein